MFVLPLALFAFWLSININCMILGLSSRCLLERMRVVHPSSHPERTLMFGFLQWLPCKAVPTGLVPPILKLTTEDSNAQHRNRLDLFRSMSHDLVPIWYSVHTNPSGTHIRQLLLAAEPVPFEKTITPFCFKAIGEYHLITVI